VWLINSRSTVCVTVDSTLISGSKEARDRPSSVWETNEATEEVTYEEDSREGGQEEGKRRRREEERTWRFLGSQRFVHKR
jgi:hypothetical protein